MRGHPGPALLMVALLAGGCSASGSTDETGPVPDAVMMSEATPSTTVAANWINLPTGPPPDRPSTSPPPTEPATSVTTTPSASSPGAPSDDPGTSPGDPEPADQVAVDVAVAVLGSVPHASVSTELLFISNEEGDAWSFFGPLGEVRVEREEGYGGPVRWAAANGSLQGSWLPERNDMYLTGSLFGDVWADDPLLSRLDGSWGVADTSVVGDPQEVFAELSMPWVDHANYLTALQAAEAIGSGESEPGGLTYPVEVPLGPLLAGGEHVDPSWIGARMLEVGLDAAVVEEYLSELEFETAVGAVTLDERSRLVNFAVSFDLVEFFVQFDVVDDVGLSNGTATLAWWFNVDDDPGVWIGDPAEGYLDVTDEIAAPG